MAPLGTTDGDKPTKFPDGQQTAAPTGSAGQSTVIAINEGETDEFLSNPSSLSSGDSKASNGEKKKRRTSDGLGSKSMINFKEQHKTIKGFRLDSDDSRNDLLRQIDQMITHDVGRLGVERETDAQYSKLRKAGPNFLDNLKAVQSRFSTDRVYVDKQLLYYQAEDLTKMSSLFTVKGTIFWNKFLWLQLLGLFILMHICSGITYSATLYVSDAEAKNIKPLMFATAFAYVNALVTFLLGFYVSTCVGRWWAVRTNGQDGLWNAINNIFMLIGMQRNKYFRAFHHRSLDMAMKRAMKVLRYALLSHRLVFMQARGEVKMEPLIEDGLLLPHERPLLEDRPAKAMIAWGWLTRHINEINRLGAVSGISEGPLLGQLVAGRNGIQTIFTFLDCQLPMPYVHIICLLVKVLLIMSSVEFGLRFGLSLVKANAPGGMVFWDPDHPIWIWLLSVIQLGCYAVFYQGILDVQQLISSMFASNKIKQDPYGTDIVDYPMVAYEHFLREEGIALLEGGMELQDARMAERARADENGQVTSDQVFRPAMDPRLLEMIKDLNIPHVKDVIAGIGFSYDELRTFPYTVVRDAGISGRHAYRIKRYIAEKEGDKLNDKPEEFIQ